MTGFEPASLAALGLKPSAVAISPHERARI